MKKIIIKPLLLCISTYLLGDVLTFSKAYDLAMENDHQIKSAVYQVEAAKEKINQAQARLYPQVNLSAYYSKSEYQYNPQYSANGSKIRQGLYSYSASLKQSIYDASIYSGIKVQKTQSKLYDTRLKLQEADLAQKVFKAYLDVLKSHNKIELLKSYLVLQDSKLKELSKKYTMNLSSKVDMLKTKVDYDSANIDLKKEQQNFKLASLKLKQYIGDVHYDFPHITISSTIDETIAQMKAFIEANCQNKINQNLNIKQAQINETLSVEKIDDAFSGHIPKVNLNATYSKFGTDDPTVDSSYSYTDRVMLTVDIPIFSGGYVSSQVRAAKLMKKSATQDFLHAKKQAVIDRDSLLARFNVAIDSLPMYQKAYESAKLYVDAVNKSFAYGLKSIVYVNDANSKLYEVKYKYIDNLNEIVDSYIGLLIVINDFEGMKYLDKIIK